jgi:hypothetical protein
MVEVEEVLLVDIIVNLHPVQPVVMVELVDIVALLL